MILQAFVGWLAVLVALAGVAVCTVFFSRSRFTLPLILGFSLEIVVDIFYRVGAMAMSAGGLSPRGMAPAFLLASLLGLLARVAIVGGIAGVLSQAGGRRDTEGAGQAP